MPAAETADAFLALADDFQLGALTTEQPHPLTTDLSRLAQEDLPQAIATLQQVDALALERMAQKLEPGKQLAADIRATWRAGGRVFLAGCGATGRLSLALKTFCRQGMLPEALREQVISFMAGGDAALIRSIEGFEDFPAYGARQLRELGFGSNDLLIASTEGGETPWVIGATEAAAELATRASWFVYCNEDAQLCAVVERSRRVLKNDAIKKWNLAVGPMAIAGSTRMQASTVLQYGIGLALELAAQDACTSSAFAQRLQTLREHLTQSWDFLAPFVATESRLYQSGDGVRYTTQNCGITTLTDTTERAPTFSLPVFENFDDGAEAGQPSLCYLSLPETTSRETAWEKLLGRAPRCLDWPHDLPATRLNQLLGRDISQVAAHKRTHSRPEATDHPFSIDETAEGITWQFGVHQHLMVPASLPFLERQLVLKLLLNAHSTLVMGRLGRYEGNLMTYVKPSNYKLIDRAIRYTQILYQRDTGDALDYAKACRELYRQRAKLRVDEPIVLKTLEALKA